MPKADPQRNGKSFALPVTAGRGRSRGRKSSAGAAGAQAVAVEEATNRAPACGRGVTRTTLLRAVGTVLGSRLPAPDRRPGAQGELERNGKLFVLPVTAGRGRHAGVRVALALANVIFCTLLNLKYFLICQYFSVKR